jgi:hypothetical protein
MTPRRIARYGRTVRGWAWRTTQERLDAAEAARIKLGITRTEFLERAIDAMLKG